MIVLELNEIEIDHCLVCEGIWLDAGELELLLGSAQERDAVLNSFQVDNKTKEKKRRCPICLKKMEKILCGKDKKILIDRCRNNDGIWFDKGELYQIIEMGSLDKDNKVLNMLKDMFGSR
jgi:hypothetical protein